MNRIHTHTNASPLQARPSLQGADFASKRSLATLMGVPPAAAVSDTASPDRVQAISAAKMERR